MPDTNTAGGGHGPYRVTTRDGRVLTRGDAFQLGEPWTFYGCTHPHKVKARRPDAGEDSGKLRMTYANVWDVEITHAETGEVTFPLTTIRSDECL